MANKFKLESLKRSDFLFLKINGKRLYPAQWVIFNFIFVQNSEDEIPKIKVGWTLGRKVGNAVLRNKLKRWCREFFRNQEEYHQLPVKVNLVFRAYEKDFYKNMEYKYFKSVLHKGMQKIRSLSKNN